MTIPKENYPQAAGTAAQYLQYHQTRMRNVARLGREFFPQQRAQLGPKTKNP